MKSDSLIEKSGHFVLKHRMIFLTVILLLTLFFAVQILKVQMLTPTIDLYPKDHPYVETYVAYEKIFGGANLCLLALEVKNGDVFQTETLTKIKEITKGLQLLPSVNNYQVLSLAQRKIKHTYVDEVEGRKHFKSDPVMWPDIPQSQEELDNLRQAVYTSSRIHGSLISLDDKAALIIAGFFDRGLESPGESLREIIERIAREEERDPVADVKAFESAIGEMPFTLEDTLFGAIQRIVKAEEDDNHSIYMIGRPILLGHIYQQFPQLYWIFLLTVFSIIFVLFLYFRDLRGVAIPTLTMIISAIWGLGLLGLLRYHFNPLVIVVPFVISARALSHSVQLIERFIEEYKGSQDRTKAATATFSGLFKPGMLSIVTDAAGIFIVILTPIPLMEKLAVMGCFWVLSIIVSDMLFNPIILSLLPPPKLSEGKKEGVQERMLLRIGTLVVGKARVPILVFTGCLFVLGFFFARNLVIGDVHPGTPLLWPKSEYNQDTAAISERFGNTETLSIVVEGENKNTVKLPQVLMVMEGLQRELELLDEVASTSSIADLLPAITKIWLNGNPKWELIPKDEQTAGFYLEMIFSGAEPGDLARFLTNDFKDANISVFLKDHKGTTLRTVVAKAKKYIASHPMEGARFRLAGNQGGLLAAVNEAIVGSEAKVTILAFSLVFILCLLAFRSAVAGILFLIPITISNYLTFALMGALGIGLDVNTLPVVSLGVGLGVDYGLYVIGRLEEEYIRSNGDWAYATITAISTAGKAVMFTATTMVAGIVFWMFSFLRFQAEMGILLAFWMIISMLGGLVLLPAIVYMIKPRFIARKVKS